MSEKPFDPHYGAPDIREQPPERLTHLEVASDALILLGGRPGAWYPELLERFDGLDQVLLDKRIGATARERWHDRLRACEELRGRAKDGEPIVIRAPALRTEELDQYRNAVPGREVHVLYLDRDPIFAAMYAWREHGITSDGGVAADWEEMRARLVKSGRPEGLASLHLLDVPGALSIQEIRFGDRHVITRNEHVPDWARGE
jgi:hypothetical protein